MVKIRPIDPESSTEIELVAARMRQTLVEVLGEEKGGEMYTMDWLIARAKLHICNPECTVQIFLAENEEGRITGHTIVRVDHEDVGQQIGLFSTTYVEPEFRRQGAAEALIRAGEDWMQSHGVPSAVTYTDPDNIGLQQLYIGLGYTMTRMNAEFVRLSRPLSQPQT